VGPKIPSGKIGPPTASCKNDAQSGLRLLVKSYFIQNQNLPKYYLSREDTSKMPIIKFVVFLAQIDNTKTQSLFFKADNIFATCCNSRIETSRDTQTNNVKIINTLNTFILSRRPIFFRVALRVFCTSPST
jgi:hypothetical protein